MVGPPAARVLHRAGQPRLAASRQGLVDLEAGLLARRRVHQRGNVPGCGEHEAALPAQQVRTAEAAIPWADVVGLPGDDVAVHLDLSQVHLPAEDREGAGVHQGVGQRHPDEVLVQAGRHAGGVGVPEQHVERRRALAHQVVVDPVVPDQVVGPQPGEHPGQRLPVEIAQPLRLRHRNPGSALVDHGADGAGPGLVEQGHAQRQPRDPVLLAGGRQVGHRQAADDATGAQAQQVTAIASGDLLHRLQRGKDRPDVGVQIPPAVLGVRVAPGDREDLHAGVQQVLDRAAARRQVGDVELVDHGWDQQQRDLADRLGARSVVDQLEDLGTQDHRTLAHGDVAADGEAGPVDHRRDAGLGAHVLGELLQAARVAAPTGVQPDLERRRVEQRIVARRGGVDEHLHDETHPLLAAPVQVRALDEVLQRATADEVGLADPSQQRVSGPGRVGEAPVALGRLDLRATHRNPAQLPYDTRLGLDRHQRPPGQLRRQLHPRLAREQPPDRAQRRVREHHVQRRAVRGRSIACVQLPPMIGLRHARPPAHHVDRRRMT